MGGEMKAWTRWADERPTDTTAKYRWRAAPMMILGMELRPEWTEKLHLCGMGYADNEWWPCFSHWNGYSRTVHPTLEWRLAREDETETFWGGLNLLPCPFTGKTPTVSATTRYTGAPEYLVEKLSLKGWMVSSYGWTDAKKMRDAWNRRSPDPELVAALELINMRASPSPARTFDDAIRDLDLIAASSRALLSRIREGGEV